MNRIDIGNLVPKNGTAIELGVARGLFSEEILKTFPKMILYSIDRWAGDRRHDDQEFQEAESRLASFPHSHIIRSTFEMASGAFADEELDWIYIDGYAHTGQESGETLRQWYPKLKPGGIFSGHDYHKRWPETIRYVDMFAEKINAEVLVTDGDEEFNSWYWRKKENS